jgi:hypothetical protein
MPVVEPRKKIVGEFRLREGVAALSIILPDSARIITGK